MNTKEELAKNRELKEKLAKYVHEIGDWNVPYNQISKDWQIPTTTLYRWRREILSEMDLISPEEYGRDIINALRSAAKQCQLKARDAPTPALQIKYFQTLNDITKNVTDLLERFGKKRKVAEQFVVTDNTQKFVFEMINNDVTKRITVSGGGLIESEQAGVEADNQAGVSIPVLDGSGDH
jgi:hypothetical protein